MTSSSDKRAVLVVDDDPFVRLDAVDMVEDLGFVAYQAANADDAIALLEKHDDIRILFTDINMPGSMDGLKLAHAVRKRWPPLVIMIASGHANVAKEKLPRDGVFFPKPYSSATFVRELARAAAKLG